MRVIYGKIRHARYLSKNTSCALSIHQKECRKILGCALSIEKYGGIIIIIIIIATIYVKHSYNAKYSACELYFQIQDVSF